MSAPIGKPDAVALFLFVADGNMPLNFAGMHPNRLNGLCERWWRKGWLDVGVSARTGRITDEGRRIADELRRGAGGAAPEGNETDAKA